MDPNLDRGLDLARRVLAHSDSDRIRLLMFLAGYDPDAVDAALAHVDAS